MVHFLHDIDSAADHIQSGFSLYFSKDAREFLHHARLFRQSAPFLDEPPHPPATPRFHNQFALLHGCVVTLHSALRHLSVLRFLFLIGTLRGCAPCTIPPLHRACTASPTSMPVSLYSRAVRRSSGNQPHSSTSAAHWRKATPRKCGRRTPILPRESREPVLIPQKAQAKHPIEPLSKLGTRIAFHRTMKGACCRN